MAIFKNKSIVVVLCLLSILMIGGSASAAQVSPQTAINVAQNYLTSHVTAHNAWNGSSSPQTTGVQVISYKGVPIGYLVSISPSGHILVSYTDDFAPVVFYSPTGTLDPAKTNDPNAIESWIIPEIYNHIRMINGQTTAIDPNTKQVIHLDHSMKTGSPHGARIAKAWQHLSVPPQSFTPAVAKAAQATGTAAAAGSASTVGPLLQTQWNQGDPNDMASPYNEYTPAEPGCSRAYTGCVATAMAQTMKYWNWPDQGVGSHSYKWNGSSFSGPTLSANFAHSYNWANMPASLSTATSSTQNDAVARLMSDVGISINMEYTCYGSGAWPSDAVTALVDNFKYSPSTNLIYRGNYTTAAWMNTIVSELNAPTPRPMMFSIYSTDGTEGHEVVIDGYQAVGGTDQVHINMGWGGYDDAYYDITNNWSAYLNWSANNQYLIVGLQPQSYPLTVNKTGNGTVTANKGSLAWSGNTGTGSYYGGTSVTLTAAPQSGSSFTGWAGAGCSGSGTCVVPMNAAQTVASNFSATGNNYTVTPSAGTGGSISPNTPQSVAPNAKVSFAVTPNSGYAISSVTGCNGALSGNTFTTTPITGNCAVTASFSATNYTVTPSAGTGGSISPSTPQSLAPNAKVSFTMTPNSGYTIASVTGCGGTMSGNIFTTAPVTASCSVVASFTNKSTLAVVISGLTNGQDITALNPATVTATATDNAAMAYMYILVDNVKVAGGATTTKSLSANLTPSSMTVGTHAITAVANDVTGNTVSQNIVVAVSPRMTVAVTSPSSGSTVSGQAGLKFSALVTGPQAGAATSLTLYLDGVILETLSHGQAVYSGGQAAFSDNGYGLSINDGTHKLYAVAHDNAGNSYTSPTVTFTSNKTPPAISITSPAAKSTINGTITFSVNASDKVGVANVVYKLTYLWTNGQAGTFQSPSLTNGPTYTVYGPGWPSGLYTVTATATDTVGIQTVTAVRSFTVNNPASGKVSAAAPSSWFTVK